ncbi:unnamed protein product [Fusarium fujikuroi]|uniref:Uncharacterized protein n=1 Tax=Fusarium fujikuroi TaxID=5127 RepID=A0A9Q9RDE9_FUSFU|nr:unnamed protein product [Fusarium fujikuroi]
MSASYTNSNAADINRGLVLGADTSIGYSNNLSANDKELVKLGRKAIEDRIMAIIKAIEV